MKNIVSIKKYAQSKNIKNSDLRSKIKKFDFWFFQKNLVIFINPSEILTYRITFVYLLSYVSICLNI